jgi:hypothetical protein
MITLLAPVREELLRPKVDHIIYYCHIPFSITKLVFLISVFIAALNNRGVT